MTILLGCIADDFTGATDLANNLVRNGMRVVQTIGVPATPLGEEVDAVVVALKSRTIPAREAVAQSLAALDWLRREGVRQVYFKYCSTFDSTAAGNIGPVTEALMAALDTRFTIACPAFPENRRTIFKGYLFAGDVLLNESGMQDHPLTTMRDANLVRVLQAQSKHKVGLIDYATVAKGEAAIRARVAELEGQGVGIAIVDAISDDDLRRLGSALKDFPLVTAGSGVAIGLPRNWGIEPRPQAAELTPVTGHAAIVSGSCSRATLGQVKAFRDAGGAALAVDPLQPESGGAAAAAMAWAAPALQRGPVLIYSSSEPDAVRAVQDRLGVEAAGARVEQALAAIARGLVERGVRRLVVAGGETSGAVVQALGIEKLRIGPQIDPGVPWCAARSTAAGGEVLHLALKSGNFGAPDFFTKAFVHG